MVNSCWSSTNMPSVVQILSQFWPLQHLLTVSSAVEFWVMLTSVWICYQLISPHLQVFTFPIPFMVSTISLPTFAFTTSTCVLRKHRFCVEKPLFEDILQDYMPYQGCVTQWIYAGTQGENVFPVPFLIILNVSFASAAGHWTDVLKKACPQWL